MTHYEIFISTFEMWRKRYRKPEIEIRRDNRMECSAQLWVSKEETILKYHSHRMGRQPVFIVVGDALHELGHYINGLPYGTFKERVESEYRAERFSLNILKKYYPKYYRATVKRVKERICSWDNPKDEHDMAFIKIKEYKI